MPDENAQIVDFEIKNEHISISKIFLQYSASLALKKLSSVSVYFATPLYYHMIILIL